MKNYDVGKIVLIIMAGTVAFVLCATVIGMIIQKTPPSEFTMAVRTKMVDLVNNIGMAVISVVAMLLGIKKNNNDDKPN